MKITESTVELFFGMVEYRKMDQNAFQLKAHTFSPHFAPLQMENSQPAKECA